MRKNAPATPPKTEVTKEQIVKLRRQGYSNQEIAEALGISYAHVANTAHKLIQEGRIKPLPMSNEERTKREEQIVKLRQQRATLQEIGDELGMTRERARQLITRITEKHGEEVFDTDDPLWIASEVANKLGVSTAIINQLCKSGEVTCRRRGADENGSWLIKESELHNMKAHPRITGERICIICKKTFVYEPGSGSRKACSNECLEEHRLRRRAEYAKKKPSPDNFQGWRKDLWQRLRTHRIPKGEEWLTISEAAKRTGLSYMQLVGLRYDDIVTIRLDPVKKWRGQPVHTYAASEMKITRQVVEAHTDNHDYHHHT